jgi:tannase/feruloyl esterase
MRTFDCREQRLGWLSASIAAFCFAGAQRAHANDLPTIKAAVACETLANAVLTAPGEPPTRINTAALVVTGAASPYCDVRGYVAPQVNFELHLPTENWTQRLLFSGCGGFCGQVTLRAQAAETSQPVQNGELAVVSSDLGHATASRSDALWAADNPRARIDFGYRGVHVVISAAKQIVARLYGQAQKFTYFSGCSDGGREGLMSAQRYPNDFNGIIAGAPVVNLTANNSLYHAWIVQHLLRPDGAQLFSEAELAKLHAAALQQCASNGGQSDDVIRDPRSCHFDPGQCNAASSNCLATEQVSAARELYAGPHDSRGKSLYFGLPVGSELSWNSLLPGAQQFASNFISFLAGDPPQYPVNLRDVSFSSESLQKYNRSGDVLNALNPDLGAFTKPGGKLLMWHGWSDGSVPPMSTIAYADRLRIAMGEHQAEDSLRLYMLPGVYHCGGGQGPDKIDLLTPLMAWVEEGVPPQTITATSRLYGKVVRSANIQPFVAH